LEDHASAAGVECSVACLLTNLSKLPSLTSYALSEGDTCTMRAAGVIISPTRVAAAAFMSPVVSSVRRRSRAVCTHHHPPLITNTVKYRASSCRDVCSGTHEHSYDGVCGTRLAVHNEDASESSTRHVRNSISERALVVEHGLVQAVFLSLEDVAHCQCPPRGVTSVETSPHGCTSPLQHASSMNMLPSPKSPAQHGGEQECM
jgi:hypothetical protein